MMRAGTFWVAVALVALYTCLHLVALPPDGFFTGDQGTKYLQVRAVLCRGPLAPWLEDPASDIDPGGEFREPFILRTARGLVGIFPPLFPAVTAPFVAMLGLRGLYVLPALAVVVVFLAGTGISSVSLRGWRAVAAGLCTVIATPVLFYGAELWEHAPAAALTTAAAALVFPGWSDRWPSWMALVAGLCLGAATGLRPEALIMAPALAAGLCLAHAPARVTIWMVVGLVMGLLALAWLNLLVFGTFVTPHVLLNATGTPTTLSGRLSLLSVLWLPRHGVLFLVVVSAGAIAVRLAAASRVEGVVAHLSLGALLVPVILLPAWEICVAGTRPGDALAYCSLGQTWVFVLGLVYGPGSWSRGVSASTPWRFLMVVPTVYLALTSVLTPLTGGSQWGARLLLPAAPLLSVAVAMLAMSSCGPGAAGRMSPARVGCSVALVLSMFMQAGGIALLAHGKRLYARTTLAIERNTLPGEVVISDLSWVPQTAARLHPGRRLLVLRVSADLSRIAVRAESLGFDRFALITSRTESTMVPPAEVRGQKGRYIAGPPIALPGRGLSLTTYSHTP